VSSDPDAIEIFELAQPDESGSKMFRVPFEISSKYDLIKFAVALSGRVYILGVNAANAFHLFRLESNGEAKDSQLDTPVGAAATDIGVFANDTILVAGYYTQEAPQDLRGRSYAALFDSSGKLLGDLEQKLSGERPLLDPARYNGFSIRPGEDGNLYVLHSDSVLVVSPSGGVVRRLRLKKPDTQSDAVGLALSGRQICVELSSVTLGKSTKPTFLVLDATTGKDQGYFAPPEDLRANWVSFTSQDGFVFLGGDKGKLKIFTLN
jgi:hypothetical protein